jgi:hypothetical protein
MTDEEREAALAKCRPENRPMLRERLRRLSPAERDDVMVRVLRYDLRGGDYAERVAVTLRELSWTVTPPADFEARLVW